MAQRWVLALCKHRKVMLHSLYLHHKSVVGSVTKALRHSIRFYLVPGLDVQRDAGLSLPAWHSCVSQ